MYEFKEDDAFDFVRHVGIQAKAKGNELQLITCPYCNGGANRKDRGTFSINLKTGQYKCLRASCSASGNMVTLAKDFDFSLGTQNDEYYRPKKQYKMQNALISSYFRFLMIRVYYSSLSTEKPILTEIEILTKNGAKQIVNLFCLE